MHAGEDAFPKRAKRKEARNENEWKKRRRVRKPGRGAPGGGMPRRAGRARRRACPTRRPTVGSACGPLGRSRARRAMRARLRCASRAPWRAGTRHGRQIARRCGRGRFGRFGRFGLLGLLVVDWARRNPRRNPRRRQKVVTNFTDVAAAMADAPGPVLTPDILEAYLRDDYRPRLQPPDPANRYHLGPLSSVSSRCGTTNNAQAQPL